MSLTTEAPKKSPSLDEFGNAILVDTSGNRIPIQAVVYPSTLGATGLAAQAAAGATSQVTSREGAPQLGSRKVPVLALMQPDGAGGLKPLGAPGVFASAPQTGTGASQNIAHGLGVTPSKVLVAAYDNSAVGADPYVIVEGAHDATNIKVTATLALVYKVLAFV